jgi:hypothetical protein
MYVTSVFYESFFQYGNRQIDYSPSAFALFPVTAANIAAGQQKGHAYAKSQKSHALYRKKVVSEEVIESTITELTGKGKFIDEHV